MINATSPAAKISPMQIDAMSAMETSTSAFMSNAVTSPITASGTMGRPHRIIALHAMSNGNGLNLSKLQMTAAPDITRNAISFFIPPSPNSHSGFSVTHFISISPFIP